MRTRVFNVDVSAPNSQGRLKLGMTATVELPASETGTVGKPDRKVETYFLRTYGGISNVYSIIVVYEKELSHVAPPRFA